MIYGFKIMLILENPTVSFVLESGFNGYVGRKLRKIIKVFSIQISLR